MKLYKVNSNGAAAEMAANLYDGKSIVRIWDTETTWIDFDANGAIIDAGNGAAHADAVDVRPDMTAAELKNARRIAATRETLRAIEGEAAAILEKRPEDMSAEERRALLRCLKIAYHDGGKIEGCASVDGCATCDFCQKMIAAAAKNPLMICGCCYADADNKYKEASRRRHTLNARILSSVLFTREELSRIVIPSSLCRINEDGDTVNATHARNIIRIAVTHQPARFGYWYKNAAAVAAGLRAEGIYSRDALPWNIRFVHSSALIGIEAQTTWFDDFTFTVYPDAATTAAAIAAGAHECNGRKCRECKYHCYTAARPDAPRNIAEYLRTDKATRAAIVDALASFKCRTGRA